MKKTPLQVYLDERDRKLLDQLAKREGLSLAETLRAAIRRWAIDVTASADPLLNLIGTLDDSTLPPDLSTRHDAYAVAREVAQPTDPKPKRRRRTR